MNINPNINEYNVFVLDSKTINSLKDAAFSSALKRARICLHQDLNSPVQEMIIALCKDSKIEPHKHPKDKPESYHLIDGAMDVFIFDCNGRVVQKIEMRQNGIQLYRIQGNVWHQPIAVSEYAVYHEVFTGPFDKSVDVYYKDWD